MNNTSVIVSTRMYAVHWNGQTKHNSSTGKKEREAQSTTASVY